MGQTVVNTSLQLKIIGKTLKILMLFDDERPEWGVSEIARVIEMPKSTVHRILISLERHEFLHQDPETRRFRLGLILLELGRRAYEGIELRQIAKPVLDRLAQETDETILLQVLNQAHDLVVCIERAQQRSGLRLILEVGATAPLHAGASSKALLAYLTSAEIEDVIAAGLTALTPHTITSPTKLRTELAEVRANGYAVSFEETDLGAAGVAVPIRDYLDRVVASLTIAGPTTRLNPSTMDRYTELALAAGHEIASKLGRHPARLNGDRELRSVADVSATSS